MVQMLPFNVKKKTKTHLEIYEPAGICSSAKLSYKIKMRILTIRRLSCSKKHTEMKNNNKHHNTSKQPQFYITWLQLLHDPNRRARDHGTRLKAC